jgi:hypothetical protein
VDIITIGSTVDVTITIFKRHCPGRDFGRDTKIYLGQFLREVVPTWVETYRIV